MSTRYIVRPHGVLSTPKRLKAWLRADKIRLIKPWRIFDWNRDFFLGYPPASQLINAPADYNLLLSFYGSNKAQQRRLLQLEGFYVPFTAGLPGWSDRPLELPYVVRPFRHSQGRDYRITTDATDYDPSSQYLSQIFPKRWEYRVITCYGKPVVTMLKRVPEGLSANDPWNHANGSSFCSVLCEEANRLRHTDIYERIDNSKIIGLAHLTGLDVLVTKERGEDFKYVITEVNFAPALTLPHQLSAIQQETINR